MTSSVTSIDEIARAVGGLNPKGRRRIIAFAGPPASGKSTQAAALVDTINRDGGNAILVPMDGFHLDNRILKPRNMLHRKGAPETFDAHGFVTLVRAIANQDQVYFPVFDRTLDCSIAGAGVVTSAHDTIIVEGNYLLLADDPWCQLADLWDYAVTLTAPRRVLRDRLIQRWLDHGHTLQEATERAEQNDLRNMDRVLDSGMKIGVTLSTSTDQQTE